MLEYMVHFDAEHSPAEMVLVRAEVPVEVPRLVLSEADLPDGWRDYPAPDALGEYGSRFVLESKAAVLIVPSALVPGERNWLLNPSHNDFGRITVLDSEPFAYDLRLLERKQRAGGL